MLKVEDVMTRSVEACSREDRLLKVAKQMVACHCSCLPVLTDGVVAAVVTSTDLRRVLRRDEFALSHSIVSEVMSSEVDAVGASDSVEAVMQLMRAHRHRRLPVIDEGGHLIGMLTVSDLVARAAPADPTIMPDLLSTLAVLGAQALRSASSAPDELTRSACLG